VLETTAQILLIPPFYENLGKRLVKSPKVYIADSGLACHLLGVDSAPELAKSPFRGALFEGFVAAEIAKKQTSRGGRREIYYFRDEQGLEVDFLAPRKSGGISLIECKATKTPAPAMATSLLRLAEAARKKRRGRVRTFLAHEPRSGGVKTRALVPGVEAVTWEELLGEV
jgi:hypothetical protein